MNLQFYSTSTLRFNAQKAWRQAVKTNIYSAAGGDVCRLQFAQLVGGERSSGRCETAATTRNPCLLGQGAVTFVTLGHFRHLDQPFLQVRPSTQSIVFVTLLDQTFSHWVCVSHQECQPVNLFNLILSSIHRMYFREVPLLTFINLPSAATP